MLVPLPGALGYEYGWGCLVAVPLRSTWLGRDCRCPKSGRSDLLAPALSKAPRESRKMALRLWSRARSCRACAVIEPCEHTSEDCLCAEDLCDLA